MSQNITLLGASYTDVPSVQLPKTGGGMASFDDTTDADAVASDILTGKTAYVNGVKLVGTSQGGGTEGYTLTNIVPSQSVTATTAASNAYMVQITTYTDVLEPGYAYLVNYDGDDYVLWCYEGWSQEYLIGDNQIVDSTYIGRLTSPFTIDYGVVDDELIFISRDTTAHTIKVDKITFIDPTATLISKTITQNGTYNASSDNADGYSSVIVNVSGGSNNFETGTLELTSDFSLTTSAKKITGLQLSFKPDYFMLTPDRDSFEAKGSYSGGLWELVAFKKSLFAPYAQSSSVSPEAVTTNDYGFFYRASVVSNSSISCGYGLGGQSFLGQNYYSRFAVNDDGTISVGRYSSASTKIFAGKYRYIAIKFQEDLT